MDYPLAAAFTVQLALYAYSQRLTKLWPSVGFYALIPLGLFVRTHYVIYAVPLFAGVLWDIAWHHRKSENQVQWRFLARHLALVISVGLLSAVLYCATNDVNSLIMKLSDINVYSGSRELTIHKVDSVLWQADNVFAGNGYLAAFGICKPGLATIQLSSRFFAAYLADLKGRQLLPLLFWSYIIGACWAFAVPRCRRRLFVCWWPLVASSAALVLLTTNNFRYYAPLLGIQCIIATFWLARNRAIRVAAVLVFTVWGLVLSGGWVTNAIPSASACYLQNELLMSNLCGDIFEVAFEPMPRNRIRVHFGQNGSPKSLLGWHNAWSDSGLFTVGTYDVDWVGLAEDIAEHVSGRGRVQVVVLSKGSVVERNRDLAGLDITNNCEIVSTLNYLDTVVADDKTGVEYFDNSDKVACTHVAEFYSVTDKPVSKLLKRRAKGAFQRLSNSIFMRLYRKKSPQQANEHRSRSDSRNWNGEYRRHRGPDENE